MHWIEVNEQKQVDALLEQFGYFHDSCLREMYMWTGTYVNEKLSMTVPGELDTKVKLLFQRQAADPCAIEILFEQVTAIHITPSPDNCDSIIYDAIVLKVEDTFYWADSYDWHPVKNRDACSSWISAKIMKWRTVNEWMGKELRYGISEEG